MAFILSEEAGITDLAVIQVQFNPLPDDKILDWSKFKQIADDIFKVHLKGKISAI